MSKIFERFKKRKTRAEPTVAWLCSPDAYDVLTCQGYTSLSHNPEIISGVETIARLIGSMTIHLMQNSDGGDIRVVNGLSRKIDIEPNKNMTRTTFIQWIVRTLFLEGNGNAIVYPYTRRGLIQDLRPIPATMTTLVPDGIWDYTVEINGASYSPDDVLHFRIGSNSLYPWKGEGYKVPLQSVADNLKQAAATEKGFMSSKWKPSLIVKVDAMVDEFSGKSGRRKLLDEYIDTDSAGEPWIIPADQFEVLQVKPLTLSDLALAEMVQLDKKTVASILGVPAYVLGVGDFNREEWNNFISSRLMPLAQMIEQEMTKKLLFDPALFFRFNVRSLYNYSLDEIVNAGSAMVDRMAMRRNEWRSWIGLPPDPDMDDILALENYLPVEELANQKKLVQNGGE
jgi:HK97 family phage portal protein